MTRLLRIAVALLMLGSSFALVQAVEQPTAEAATCRGAVPFNNYEASCSITYRRRQSRWLYTITFYHHNVGLTWNGSQPSKTVWNPRVSNYFSNVDGLWNDRGVNVSEDWEYAWGGGEGHRTHRQRRIENCIIKYGCITNEYPWVKIWAHWDGSANYSSGR